MKLEYFDITTKDNTTCYDSVKDHIAKTYFHHKLNVEQAIANDFIAQLRFEFITDEGKQDIRVMSHDVASLVEWLKENHPEVHALVPPFRIDVFQALAEKMKSSSHLSYTAIDDSVSEPEDLEFEFGCDPETDDFVPEMQSVNQSLREIIKQGFYTELHCYPDTPGGFWNYYGLDFESLFNHILKED